MIEEDYGTKVIEKEFEERLYDASSKFANQVITISTENIKVLDELEGTILKGRRIWNK